MSISLQLITTKYCKISSVKLTQKFIKMNKTEIEDIKQTIEWLLHNGDFKDTETAYNSAMNSINTLDEAINFTDSCKQLNVLFAKGDKVIVEDCGKATIIEVISDTTARVKYDNDENIWTAGLYYLKHQ